MAKKKRLCPECGKEFEFEEAEVPDRTPCCDFPLRAYDDRRRLSTVEQKERDAAKAEADKAAAEKKKKRAGGLSHLNEL